MENNTNEFRVADTDVIVSRRAYSTPHLRLLGDVQEVVQSNGQFGNDGGGSSS
jgi:hypothetical protein